MLQAKAIFMTAYKEDGGLMEVELESRGLYVRNGLSKGAPFHEMMRHGGWVKKV